MKKRVQSISHLQLLLDDKRNVYYLVTRDKEYKISDIKMMTIGTVIDRIKDKSLRYTTIKIKQNENISS